PQLQQQLQQKTAGYSINFKDTNGQVASYPLKQTGISIDAKNSALQTKSGLTRKWVQRLEWWQPIKLPLAIKTDKEVFQDFLNKAVIKADQPYQNANFTINGGDVGITPEAAGKGRTIKYPES